MAFFAQKKIDFLILLAKTLEIFYEHRLVPFTVSCHLRHGKPQEIVHDNAQEFMHGTFKDIRLKQTIKQTKSPPFEPNKIP